ncbi:poly A polymerase regulatory subunit, putative [Bodo saltans]|uniref:Cap-specific mRNA (nucleoside-2'-O-)-methyltransferase n=1 Tax=Bodo saltans TaxID=75058 RepID=A0A0S4IHM6_BODSA|nr:poly A polymerase regulatory subunit, putative [Bodo saltans]|eukprot:CUE66663.1 poly A polymerase regulatory subunit, putative [Bodo saltans]
MPLPQILNQLRKRPRQESATTSTAVSPPGPTVNTILQQNIVHYNDEHPFPFVMDSEFPAEGYRSRFGDTKTAIHWGQRKLLLSEMQLLSHYARPGVSYHIVYAGSAPGTHLGFLDDITNCIHTWELVDPGQFDRDVLGPRKNFLLRNEFFTNATAYGINATRLSALKGLRAVYEHVALDSVATEKSEIHARLDGIIGHLDVARGTTDIPSIYETPLTLPVGLNTLCQVAMERKPLLFVSDIRSGSVELPNFEEHVVENMKAQQAWTEILQGDFAMLKFRLPYTSKATGPGGAGAVASKLIDDDGCVEYLGGDMVLPIWTRPTSTEGRLVVPRGTGRIRYNVQRVEDQFFFFNAKLREHYHFNHILSPHVVLDNHFDGAAEVNCLREFCTFMDARLTAPGMKNKLIAAIEAMSTRITVQLKLDFEAAVRRRDAIVLKQARLGLRVVDEEGGEDVEGPSSLAQVVVVPTTAFVSWEADARRMMDQAAKERLRPIWWGNLTLPASSSPSTATTVTTPTPWRSVPVPSTYL